MAHLSFEMAKPKTPTCVKYFTVAQKMEILQLADQKVRSIRYVQGKRLVISDFNKFQVSQTAIAKKFGCGQAAVSGIVKKRDKIQARKPMLTQRA